MTYYAAVVAENHKDGHYTFPGITSGEKWSNNKRELARRWRHICRNSLFVYYPIIIEIRDDRTGEIVERWKQEQEGGRIYKLNN